MSADEGSLTGAALGMSPPPSDNGALGDDLPSSFHPWWGPESCVWLLVEEPNDIALDPVEQWRRLSFLLEYGDYAARVWNCLLKASRALKSPIYKSVVQFRDNLTQELKDSSDETKKRIRLVERCVVYLINQGLDIDLEMVKLAILVYSKRNITCHARIGEISNSAALRREIERANRRLPEVLPSDQSRNYSAWQRILAFYGSSQDFINLNPALGLAVSCPSPTSEACPPTHGAVRSRTTSSIVALTRLSRQSMSGSRSPLVLFLVKRGRGIACRIRSLTFLGKGVPLDRRTPMNVTMESLPPRHSPLWPLETWRMPVRIKRSTGTSITCSARTSDQAGGRSRRHGRSFAKRGLTLIGPRGGVRRAEWKRRD